VKIEKRFPAADDGFVAGCAAAKDRVDKAETVSTEKHFLIDNRAYKQILFSRSGSCVF
jgi:hypothetical protein